DRTVEAAAAARQESRCPTERVGGRGLMRGPAVFPHPGGTRTDVTVKPRVEVGSRAEPSGTHESNAERIIYETHRLEALSRSGGHDREPRPVAAPRPSRCQ